MQVLQIPQGLLGAGEIDSCRVREILASIARHRAHIAQRAGSVSGGARQSLGAEDEDAEHAEDEDLPKPDVEHSLRVRRIALRRVGARSAVLATAQDDEHIEGPRPSARLDADLLAGEPVPDGHDELIGVGHRPTAEAEDDIARA